MAVSGMRTGISLSLVEADRQRLEALVIDRNTPQKHVWRARIVLLSADGVGTNAVMAATGTSKTTVWRWQARFMAEGVDGLLRDKTRPPGRAPVAGDRAAAIVALTLKPPPHEATHWTAQAMAKAVGLAVSTVQKIWKAHGLAPHRWRAFKLSNDPAFEHDIPAGMAVHVILDNYAAHKHIKVREWLDRHPRWTFHFTPTSSSWLNAVEGFFAKLTRRRLKHGVFCSIVDLQAAINRFLAEHNQNAKPFIWRADPDAIIAARNRGFQALESIH